VILPTNTFGKASVMAPTPFTATVNRLKKRATSPTASRKSRLRFWPGKRMTPFFCGYPTTRLIRLFNASKTHYDQLDHIEDPIKRVYNAMILSLDENIGQLMNAVEKFGIE
jgi:hypothetical protein